MRPVASVSVVQPITLPWLGEKVKGAEERVLTLKERLEEKMASLPVLPDLEEEARKRVVQMRQALASGVSWAMHWRAALLEFYVSTVDKERFQQEVPQRYLRGTFMNLGHFRYRFNTIENKFYETMEKERDVEERIDQLRIARHSFPLALEE